MMPRLKSWLFFIRIQWPLILGVVLVGAVFYLTFQFVEPPPPKHLVLASGPKDGGYDYYAHAYAKALAKKGIEVEIRPTQGSLENLELMKNPASGVDVAFAQGGVGWLAGAYAYSAEESPIRSLAEIYREPLWIFTRRNAPFSFLRELRGKRLAVGLDGSGTQALSVDLLKWNGINAGNSIFLELASDEAVRALVEGKVDAAFFVGGAGSPFLNQCAADPALQLHSFGDASTYARRFSYLSAATLPQGVLDLALNVPPNEVVLVAPSATLVAREDLHPALAYLLLTTAKELHGGHTILSNTGDFPSNKNLEFLPHKEAARYFQNGPPLLQRFLPYHVAAFIDRTKILILPLLTLMLPLVKIAYPTYQWSIRRNIWKWYRAIRLIESDHYRGKAAPAELLSRIDELEERVARVNVPFSYASELYTVRQHIVMVRGLVTRRLGGGAEAG